jgi:hypothetical protein
MATAASAGDRLISWSPPEKYLNSGPIGFTYYLQTWFRYYLQQYIEHARAEIETKEGTYSIDFGGDENDGGIETMCWKPVARLWTVMGHGGRITPVVTGLNSI